MMMKECLLVKPKRDLTSELSIRQCFNKIAIQYLFLVGRMFLCEQALFDFQQIFDDNFF